MEGNPLAITYSVLVSFWSVYFLSMWRRRQNELMFLWGTDGYEQGEHAREEFEKTARDIAAGKKSLLVSNEFLVDETTGKTRAVETKPWLKYGRFVLSFGVIAVFILVVFWTVLFAMYVKLDKDMPYAKYLGSGINAVSIVVFGKAYEAVAVKLNDMENHRTQTQYEDSQIMKSFVFQAMNNFFVLFFIAFLKQGTIGFPNVGLSERNSTCTMIEVDCDPEDLHNDLRDDCVGEKMMVPSCMSELQLQLIIVFCFKQFFLGSLELLIPFCKAKAKAGIKELERKDRREKQSKLGADEQGKADQMLEDQAIELTEERVMEEYGTVFQDYNELAVQFGYSTLFAVAFPVAPLMAMINNCVELRTDAFKLCKVHRRPEYTTRQDIGSWMTVLETVAVMSVMMNAALTGFVGSQTAAFVGTLEHEELSSFRRLQDPQLWMAAVFIEHCILALRFLIFSVVPDVPGWIPQAKHTLEETLAERMMTDEERTLKKSQHEAFAKKRAVTKLSKSASSVGKKLPGDARAGLVEMFYEIDLDRSGTLSEHEANGALVKSLRPGSGGKTTVQWDTDDNMKVSLVEWLQGWEQVFESAGEEAANDLMQRTKKRNAKRVAEMKRK